MQLVHLEDNAMDVSRLASDWLVTAVVHPCKKIKWKKYILKIKEIIHPGVGEEQHEELHGWSWVLHNYVPVHSVNFTHPRQWREYSQRRLAIIVKLVGTEQFCTEGVTNNPVERSFHYSRYVLRIFKIAKPECKTTSTIAATTSSQVEGLRGWKSRRER